MLYILLYHDKILEIFPQWSEIVFFANANTILILLTIYFNVCVTKCKKCCIRTKSMIPTKVLIGITSEMENIESQWSFHQREICPLKNCPCFQKGFTKIILITPVTTVNSARNFLTLKKVETSLLSTMADSRPNHHFMIHLYKEELDEIDIISITNEFVTVKKSRIGSFIAFVCFSLFEIG